MQENQTRNGMAIILAAAVITVLLGLGRGEDAPPVRPLLPDGRGSVDDALRAEVTWTLLDPAGVVLQPAAEEDWIARARTTAFDVVGFRDHLIDVGDQPIVELPLFDDLSLIASTRQVVRQGDARFTWVGDLDGIFGGHAIFSVYDGVAHGMINATGLGLFELQPHALVPGADGEGGKANDVGYVLREVDAAALPPCGVGPEQCVLNPREHQFGGIAERWRQPAGAPQPIDNSPHAGRMSGPPQAASNEPYVLRVLVAYTPAARNAAGGHAAMMALINSTMAQTNLAFENSLINMDAELAHTHLVDYSGSGNIVTDLQRFTGVDNGFMDEVHELRALHQADLVALLVTYGSGACGVAWCMTTPTVEFAPLAFSVTRIQCISNLTFEHELGHNMGCHHDHQNSGGSCGSFSYSFGRRFFGSSGSQWRTVLAYSPGQRISYFSNPTVFFDGQPTGVPAGQAGEAHNAQTINLNAPIVTSFAEQFEPPIPPVNDTCETRVVIGDGSTPFHNNFSSTDGPEEPDECTYFDNPNINHDVWFEYTATCTGDMTVDLCDSSFATKLGIYVGNECPTGPNSVAACDTTSCSTNNNSLITMEVAEGQTFIIRIGSRIESTGDGVMTIACEEVKPGIPGDLNNDGVVDGADLLILLSQWGECHECDDCPADLDNDCTVDGADLLILLANWG